MTGNQKEASIEEIHRAMEEGTLTSAGLVETLTAWIEEINEAGPELRAVRMLNPDAADEARARDEEWQNGVRRPLQGIPVLLKDNIEAGTMPTTAGAEALRGNVTGRDAFLVKQLREAGAVILGKTNLSEWAFFMTDGAPSGYSTVGGQVKHPHGPETFEAGSVGGSSSGSGAAVSAGMAPIAVGTETSGSILSPASANSLVGLKPTVGAVSRNGIIPLAESQDTAGPMARTVRDAALLFGAITGEDESDEITKKGETSKDYTSYLDTESLTGAIFGIDWDYAGKEGSEERRLIEEAVSTLRRRGAVVRNVTIPKAEPPHVLFYEMKRGTDAYLSASPAEIPVRSLDELLAFNREDPEGRMRFGQTLLEQAAEKSSDPDDAEYVAFRETDVRTSREEGVDAVMAEHALDGMLSVNNHGAALPAKAGYPSITIPVGAQENGMPVGLTITARAWEEPRLVAFGSAVEAHAGHRVVPALAVEQPN
ncbi:amidase family protein [Alkalicoccus chagannorensis]|uniref:amidase family protein n=1 Tax=Alkalicoccus chagannorensis TaxID=427072 RepID=UPI0004106CFA|nr:amidase family protein [Alkalicoccus chagannorensis]